MELMFWGLQYWRVWGSSLWDQMAETDAWHPWVTTLPSGHASIRSRRSTTYCTRMSPLLLSSAFVASFGESEVNWLIEIELSRLDKQRASGMLLILAERLLMRTGGVKLGKQAGKRRGESKYDMLLIYICARVCVVSGDGHTHPNKLYYLACVMTRVLKKAFYLWRIKAQPILATGSRNVRVEGKGWRIGMVKIPTGTGTLGDFPHSGRVWG